jgi:hypothetical protein
MAQFIFAELLGFLAYYSFAVFNCALYLGLSLYSREFFRKDTEKDKNQYAIGRTRPILGVLWLTRCRT